MRRIGSGVLAWILAVAMFLEPAACAVVSAQEPVLTQEEQADGKEGLTEEPGTEENEGQEEEKKEPEEDGEDAAEEEQDSQPDHRLSAQTGGKGAAGAGCPAAVQEQE